MVAPPSGIEFLRLKGLSKVVANEKVVQEKRKQLLTANKIAARSLLLGISFASSEQIVTQKRDE